MGLYRRKDSSNPKVWYMNYYDAHGKQVRRSTGTENKQLAQAALDKMTAEVWEQKKLGVKQKRLFSEAAKLFLEAKAHKKALRDYERQINWWQDQFKGKYLHEITQDLIIKTIEAKRKSDGIAAATMNRYLAALRGCLRLAILKHQWLDRGQLPEFFLESEPRGRTRWLRPDEVTRLLNELPEHWKDIAGFALATGQRLSNVLGLRWDQVDLVRRVVVYEGEVMKNGEDHGIGLSETAAALIQKQMGRHPTHVFSYRGKPLKTGGYATWQKAVKAAGIEDLRRHDLRHTWASMMVQAGVSDAALMALGSWKTPKMVRRYGHLNAESLRPFAQTIDKSLGGAIKASVSFDAQNDHRGELEEQPPKRLRLVSG